MTTCPLPIDWLDLLEGRTSSADRAHMADCPSCRAIVDSLEETSAREPQFHAVPAVPAVTLEDRPTPLAAGQIRWLETPGADARIPVLVLDVDDEEPATDDPDTVADTVQVVPVWTDRENATSSDLLLSVDDTTTRVPWRVAFRRQTVLPSQAIGNEVGELTSAGRVKVSSAVDGITSPDSSGADIESEFDPRLTADDWLGEVVEQVRARMSGASRPADDGIDTIHSGEVGHVLVFEVKRLDHKPNQGFALAAASAGATESAVLASLRTASGIEVDGEFQWLLPVDGSDRLALHANVVRGVDAAVQLTLFANGQRFEVTTHLASGADVILAQNGVSHLDVEGLEMRVL